MTKADKEAYILRICSRLDKQFGMRGDHYHHATVIFKAAKALHSRAIVGSQKKKKSADEMDADFKDAFPALIAAIK